MQEHSQHKRSLKAIIITITALGALVLLGIGAYTYFFHKYWDAEQKLRGEYSRLSLPDITQQNEEFSDGICLDNCPLLERAYSLQKTTLAKAATALRDTLNNKGYHSEKSDPGNPEHLSTMSFSQKNGNYTIFIAFPDATTSDKPTLNTEVSSVIVQLSYRP